MFSKLVNSNPFGPSSLPIHVKVFVMSKQKGLESGGNLGPAHVNHLGTSGFAPFVVQA